MYAVPTATVVHDLPPASRGFESVALAADESMWHELVNDFEGELIAFDDEFDETYDEAQRWLMEQAT